LFTVVTWEITSKSIGSGLGAASLTGSGSGSCSEVDTGGGGEVDASSPSGFMYSIASTAYREIKMS
jgi:hypothetical protein